MKMKRKKKLTAAFGIVCILLFAGCSGKSHSDSEKSPRLQNIELTSYNEGSEDSQYVEATLQFDQEVRLSEDPLKNMRITISGERMEDIEVNQEEKDTVCLTIPVTTITRGNLEITEEKEDKGYPGITDADGDYTVWTFDVDALIPSGVTLVDVEHTQKGGFQKQVVGMWNVRNITWIQLYENGTLVESSNDKESESMDGAIAVHGHDFLDSDSTMIAEDIVEALNQYYARNYIFTQDGDIITGQKLDGGDSAELELEIYQYQHITQK